MKYVIQYQINPSFCLGVSSATAGTPVLLNLLAGVGNPNTQWDVDPSSGLITLVGNSNLALAYSGTIPGNGTPLIVAQIVLGAPSQRWNWVGNPPDINSLGAPGFVVDNSNGGQQPGNKIQLWQFQGGNTNQAWTFTPVPTLEKFALQDKELVSAR
jgi:hypothetical protein